MCTQLNVTAKTITKINKIALVIILSLLLISTLALLSAQASSPPSLKQFTYTQTAPPLNTIPNPATKQLISLQQSNRVVISSEFRISETGPDGLAEFEAFHPAIAYNSTTNQYLVVWHGDTYTNTATFGVYGQLIDAATGATILDDFLISAADIVSDTNPDHHPQPDVVYNPIRNQFLVVWNAHPDGDDLYEIYGQQILANGTLTGSVSFRISDMGASDGSAGFDAYAPSIAYNSTNDQYLVAWRGDDDTGSLVNGEDEIFGQLLAFDSSGFITETGTNDFRISEMGIDGETQYDASNPDVAYNSTNNTFLVVWDGNNTISSTNANTEIYAQQISTTGLTLKDDYPISLMGNSLTDTFKAATPAIAYNPLSDEFLVVWSGEENGDTLREIYGQRLDGNGTEVGLDDFPVALMAGGNGDAYLPAIHYSSYNNEYLVLWNSDEDTANQHEVYGQRLDADGSQIGQDDFVLTAMNDSLNTGDTVIPAIAYNPANNNYLFAWSGFKLISNTAESEIFGLRYRLPFTITPITFTLQEAISETGIFTITLFQAPTATVSLTLTTVNSQCAVSPLSPLVLDATNWQSGVTATVTAINDALDDGDQLCPVITSQASSADPIFNGESLGNVLVMVIDDDTAGYTLSPTGAFTLTEPNQFTIANLSLNSQPTSTVTINLAADDLTECDVSPNTLQFYSNTWSINQPFTITAVDDFIVDGNQPCTIQSNSISFDPIYTNTNPPDINLTILDNNYIGVNITPSTPLTVSEAGLSAVFTMTIGSQPTASVTINLTTTTECTVSTSIVVFSTTNPIPITVSAIDDFYDDGDQVCMVSSSPAQSADPAYNNLSIADVPVWVLDNDETNVIVNPINVTLSEPSGITVSNISLSSQPTANVTIFFASSDPTECTTNNASITLDGNNWNSGDDAIIQVVDDILPDGTQFCTITTTLSTTDTTYNLIDPADIIVEVLDNEQGTILLPSTLTVSEPNISNIFTVSLSSIPTATVSFNLISTNLNACNVSTTTVILDASNAQSGFPVTVTPVDDAIDDGPQTCIIQTDVAVSADNAYNGLNPTDVTVTVEDDDVSNVVINQSGNNTTVSENGTTDSYTLKLNSEPTANVEIAITPDTETDLGNGASTPITLSFSTANWNIAQTIIITAIDDGLAEGIHTSTIVHIPSSSDSLYNSLVITNVLATVLDNDGANVDIIISNNSTEVEEGGFTDSYNIVLNSQPTDIVLISVNPDTQTDVGSGAGTSIQLIFTPANWNEPQTVTVTANDDAIIEGQHSSTISHTAQSTDSAYHNIFITDVTVIVYDNDGAIAISETSLNLIEGSDVATYHISLNAQPIDNVQVMVNPGNQLTVNNLSAAVAITLTFSTTTWDIPQVITVSAVDDFIAEGAHTDIITHSSSSTDSTYNNIIIDSVTANITDNDEAAIILNQSNGTSQVSEDGQTDSYSLVLNSEPTSNVTIIATPNTQLDIGAGVNNSISLTFSPLNWHIPQTITITANDDSLAEGTHNGTINHSIATTDSMYAALSISQVIATIIDNDSSTLPTSSSIYLPLILKDYTPPPTPTPTATVIIPTATTSGTLATPTPTATPGGSMNTPTPIPTDLPDLVITQLIVTGDVITVTISNQGDAAIITDQSFWVDLYIDPDPVPTMVNQTWEGLTTLGGTWLINGAALPFFPGETLTIVTGGDYWVEEFSNFTGGLVAGVPVYIQVDSADAQSDYGAILESHEVQNEPYNNIAGPVVVPANKASTKIGTAPSKAIAPPTIRFNAPLRP